ncbi:LAME_0H00980g1_1 [Lachancea meyersii CBS 8951]|uniref:LAME_0H00980g1_1 n=1 Tax=Lachancea meyersii CBS 8951 TaxID=1266667 RepID=A0A1G4KDB0_9SACH|nr:LAME_0H00980g1_1 [Lachancea meyersii CBS 8951]
MQLSTTTVTSASHTATLVYGSHTNVAGQSVEYRVYPFYHYTPTLAGAAVFAVLFGIAFVTLCVQLALSCRNRTRAEQQLEIPGFSKENPFQSVSEQLADPQPVVFAPVTPCTNKRLVTKFVPLLIGMLTECGGYIARIASKNDVYALGPYVAQTVMLLVAAAFMAATIYMNFGRLLVLMNATSVSFVPIRFSTTIFVACDVLSILLQAAGGSIMGATDDHTLGSNVTIAGLAVQVLVFGLFVITEIRFLLLADKVSPLTPRISRQWKILNLNLFWCSILILVRSIVRLVEFVQGYSGYIMEHEWFIYVFDAVPMFVVGLLFIVTFPKGNLFKVEFECTSLLESSQTSVKICP